MEVLLLKDLNVGANAMITGFLTAGSFAVNHLIATDITVDDLQQILKFLQVLFYAPIGTINNLVALALSSGTFNVSDVTAGCILC
jgi:hypothetical protein